MKLDFLGRISQTRRILKTLDRIAVALERQTVHIERLTVHLCGPAVEDPDETALRTHSGVSFSTDREQVWILDVIDRFHKASGREPTEEELVELLEARR